MLNIATRKRISYRILSLFILIFLSIPISLFSHTRLAISMQGSEDSLRLLEQQFNARIGICIAGENGQTWGYRHNERFPMCSTSKFMVVSAVLYYNMQHKISLEKRLYYTPKDYAGYSPCTAKHVHEGMTVEQLCLSALEYSDNTAVNLLIDELGGLSYINSFARIIGDKTFRLDRKEPELNSAIPGDDRDTNTPAQTVADLHKVLLTNILAAKQRTLLKTWMLHNTTGDQGIRAAVPKTAIVADKTGSGDRYQTKNDIGIVWDKEGHWQIIAIYFTGNEGVKVPPQNIVAQILSKCYTSFVHQVAK